MIILRVLIIFTIIRSMTGCKLETLEIWSFNESEYVYANARLQPDKVGIGNVYVNRNERRLTLERDFHPNNKRKEDHFYLNNKPFGPQRFYDTTGKLVLEKIAYADFDSTKCVYLADQKIMRTRK